MIEAAQGGFDPALAFDDGDVEPGDRRLGGVGTEFQPSLVHASTSTGA